MGKRELVALLNLSSWCLLMVELLFLAMPQCCLRFVIVVFPDHTHLLFLVWDEYVVPFGSRIGLDVKHDVGCQGSKQAHAGYETLAFRHN